MQLVAGWEVCVHEAEKIACNVCLDVLAERRVKPNYVALPIPVALLCSIWHVFQLMAEVSVS